MKVLLQNVRTKRYVAPKSRWTADPDQALDFGEVVVALDYALNYRLRESRPVLKFQDAGFDLKLPPVVVGA